MSQQQQKVAIVTGAGRGIGRAIALALAQAGFGLSLAARTFDELAETRDLSGLPAARSLIVLVDLTDGQAPEALFRATLDHFGRVDVLVNNAGWGPARTPLMKFGATDLDRMIAVNLRSPIALTCLVAAQMARQPEGGAIINIASTAARTHAAGEAVYAAVKAGLVAFTHASFEEFRGHNIRTSVLLPGLTDTALIPHNKRLNRALMLRPQDVAAAVMSVLCAPAGVCPLEIVLRPARDPLRPR